MMMPLNMKATNLPSLWMMTMLAMSSLVMMSTPKCLPRLTSPVVLPLQTAPKINKKPKGKNSVIDLLKRRAEDQCSLAKVIEKLVTQEENTKEEDEIEVFMRSMTLTIKKLTPAEQSEAKRKIFNVVNEIEERHHSRAHTLNTFNYSRTPSTLSYESSVSDAVLLDEFNAFT